MKLYSAKTPFIRHLLEVLGRLGREEAPVIKRLGRESLFVSYFPEPPHGIPILNDGNGTWEPWLDPSKDYNLVLAADDQRRLWLYPGQEGGALVELELESADELPELLEFFESADATRLGRVKWLTKPLAALLEGVFRYDPARTALQIEPLWPPALVSGGPMSIRDSDIVVTETDYMATFGRYRCEQDSLFDISTHAVIRLRSEVSAMFFTDYLLHASEASELVSVLRGDRKKLIPMLERSGVALPTTKQGQTARSIELRTAKLAYRSRVKSLSYQREPLEQIVPLYRKRIRCVDSMHDELLDEVGALRAPLPFFIEYPYRRFRRAHDPLQKLRYGQMALTLLAKIPLFLVVEELAQSGSHSVDPILKVLREERLSDGGLLELRRRLGELLRSLDPGPGPLVFFSLVETMTPRRDADDLVAARNRFHHPPFDADSFRRELEATLPAWVEALRHSLNGVQFLIPQTCQFRDGQRIISARNVSCVDTEFPLVTFTTTAPFEAFPVEQLVAYRAESAATVVVKKLIVFRKVASEAIDFGVFDRMKGDQPEFDYLREPRAD